MLSEVSILEKPVPAQQNKAEQTNGFRYVDAAILAALTVVVVILTYYRLRIQWAWGPGFDTFAFLNNALTMAGKSTYFEIYRPPLLPFLTSLVFRAGFVSETSIYLVDAGFLLAGVYGLYLLCRMRLTRVWSAAACFLFLSFPDVIDSAAGGLSDIAAVAISIWLIYVTVLAVDRDKRFYAAVAPLFILAFLTRFTAAVMVFPVIFYILLRGGLVKNLWVFTKGALGAAAIMAVDLVYYYSRAGGDMIVQLSAPYAIASTVSTTQSKLLTGGTTAPKTFFITGLPGFLANNPAGVLLMLVLGAGLVFGLARLLRPDVSKDKKPHGIALFLGLAVAVYLIIFSGINFLVGDMLLVLLALYVFKVYFKVDERLGLVLLMAFWLATFLLYHSHQAVKVSRYFITMAPSVAFFIALGLEDAGGWLRRRLKSGSVSQAIIAAGATAVIILALFSTYSSYRKVADGTPWGISGIKEASVWTVRHAPPGAIIYADDFVATAWYARRAVKVMPYFTNPIAFNQELEKYHADYFVSIWHREDMPSYRVIKRFGGVFVYKRKAKPAPPKPAMFLIGKDIDNYLEELLGYRYYLVRKRSPFPDDPNKTVGTTFVDDYNMAQLRKYPVLLLYDFRWNNIETAENILLSYARQGGTIVVDMSGNNGLGFYDLSNADFLGTVIRTRELPRTPAISFPSNTGFEKGVDVSKFARFIAEDGAPWFGDAYGESRVPSSNLKPLVDINKDMLFAEQRVGKGRIIWIAYNFSFHAFLYKSTAEKQLLRNVFKYAFKK